MASRIEDYALIGDCETAALVGRDGSVDWLCWPRFDSDACFAALLGEPKHGRWRIGPKSQAHVRRQYRDNTLILETHFETAEGAVTLVDFMPPRNEESDLVRLVIGERGRVPMRLELILRFGYGAIVPWVARTEDVLNLGDMVMVKVIGVDRDGKVKLSRKALLPEPEGGVPAGASAGGGRDRDRDRDRGDRGGRDRDRDRGRRR